MKAYFIVSCLLAISTIFANSAKQADFYQNEDETNNLFQRYLGNCHTNALVNQPVYSWTGFQGNYPSASDVIILDLDPPSSMPVNDVAEQILYGNADVVHLKNIPTNIASQLYELLQQQYAHFIHVPIQEKGLFIASKYPLKDAEVTQVMQEDAPCKNLLSFTVLNRDIYTCVCTSDLSIRVVSSNDNEDPTIIPVLLVDMPGILTIVKQELSPFQFAERRDLFPIEPFEIIPISRRGGNNEDKGGGYGGGRVDVKITPDKTEWSASAFGGYVDDRGNYIEVEVRKHEDGSSSASAEAGHDKDK